MRVSQLIDALSKMDQDAQVVSSILFGSEHGTHISSVGSDKNGVVYLDVDKHEKTIELAPR